MCLLVCFLMSRYHIWNCRILILMTNSHSSVARLNLLMYATSAAFLKAVWSFAMNWGGPNRSNLGRKSQEWACLLVSAHADHNSLYWRCDQIFGSHQKNSRNVSSLIRLLFHPFLSKKALRHLLISWAMKQSRCNEHSSSWHLAYS